MAEEEVPGGNLALTATWTAAVRAAESARDDALFSDPWADALAGPEGQAWLAARTPESVLPIALRTRFFDDFIVRTLESDGIRQVVLMAAGLDTRAYRLDLPSGTRVFEIDGADVLERKQRILAEAGAQPKCERIPVVADLMGDWETALVEAGIDPIQPAVWLLEGFLFYLPTAEVAHLLDRVGKAASGGSSLGFDTINGEVLTSPITRPWVEMQAGEGAPWLGTVDDPKTYLARRRWKVEQTQFGEAPANFGRWTPAVVPADERGVPRFWLVTARKPYALQGEGEPEGLMSRRSGRPGGESLLLQRRHRPR